MQHYSYYTAGLVHHHFQNGDRSYFLSVIKLPVQYMKYNVHTVVLTRIIIITFELQQGSSKIKKYESL